MVFRFYIGKIYLNVTHPEFNLWVSHVSFIHRRGTRSPRLKSYKPFGLPFSGALRHFHELSRDFATCTPWHLHPGQVWCSSEQAPCGSVPLEQAIISFGVNHVFSTCSHSLEWLRFRYMNKFFQADSRHHLRVGPGELRTDRLQRW